MRVVQNSLATDKPVALGFPIELEFRSSVFFFGGRKTLRVGTRTNNELKPHMMPGPGIEPGPHWWEANALTTVSVPSCSPK